MSSARTSSRASAGTTSPRSTRSTPSGTCSTRARRSWWPTTPRASTPATSRPSPTARRDVRSLFSSTLQTPGLKLGRTDPNVDPQGRDFIYMLELAQTYCNLPSDTVAKILGTSDFGTSKSSQIYAESALDSTLQSGQLDASSAFITQAISCTCPYIKLPDAISLGERRRRRSRTRRPIRSSWRTARPSRARRRSSTSPRSARPPPPGTRSSSTRSRPPAWPSTSKAGYTVLTPTVFGDNSAVPAAIQSELGS